MKLNVVSRSPIELQTKGVLYAPLYDGAWVTPEIIGGDTQVMGHTLHFSPLLADGTILLAVVTKPRPPIPSVVIVYDIVRFGKAAVTESLALSSRVELMEMLMPPDYTIGMLVNGTSAIANSVYLVSYSTSQKLYAKCADPRCSGLMSRDPTSPSMDVHLCNTSDDEDCDSASTHPPIENEAERVMSYQNMVRAMIRKMTGKWRDCARKSHCPGQLPYDSDDLMQKGLMEVMIALRKYDASHASKAKDSTFAYRHLWNRMGQIAVKYSKQSRGYGVYFVRDFIDESGHLTPSTDSPQRENIDSIIQRWMKADNYSDEDSDDKNS